MNFAYLILSLLSNIYAVVRSDASASETSFDKLYEMVNTMINTWDRTMQELENDLYRPKPEFMTFAKHKQDNLGNLMFGPDELSRSRNQNIKYGKTIKASFNETISVFQAPVSGTYHFTLTVDSSYSFLATVKAGSDERMLGYIVYDFMNPIGVTPISVLAHLEAHEIVWIECYPRLVSGVIKETSFSGFLVDAQ